MNRSGYPASPWDHGPDERAAFPRRRARGQAGRDDRRGRGEGRRPDAPAGREAGAGVVGGGAQGRPPRARGGTPEGARARPGRSEGGAGDGRRGTRGGRGRSGRGPVAGRVAARGGRAARCRSRPARARRPADPPRALVGAAPAGTGRAAAGRARRDGRPGPLARSVLTICPPPSSATVVRPSGPGPALPLRTTAPVKSATNADAGSAASFAAVPRWTIRPRSITATSSPSVAASAKSWVTR